MADGDAARRSGGVRSDAASAANKQADEYLLAVVLFAMALFFAGISGKLPGRLPRELLLGLGGAVWLSTAIWVATFPVSFTHTG